MPLPRNVRPNPYQSLANEQWAATERAQMITPRQGFNPRVSVGHPARVARSSLTADQVPYGQMPVQRGMRAAGWQAAANAAAAEASQTLQLHGMLDVVYGRRSGTGVREMRVRKMPVSAIVPEYGIRGLGFTPLPASRLSPGPAHGLGSLSEMLTSGTYTGAAGVTACAQFDDPVLMAAVGAMLLGLPSTDTFEEVKASLDSIGVVFGEQNALCAVVQGMDAYTSNGQLDSSAVAAVRDNPSIKPLLATEGSKAFYEMLGAAILYSACKQDVECTVRGIKAARTMAAKGWWEKDKWEFRWKYLSGYTVWYKNPLYLGGGAVGGLLLYSVAKKKKRGRR